MRTKISMADNQGNRTKVTDNIPLNLMSVINEGYDTQDEEETPTTSPKLERSPALFCSTTNQIGKEPPRPWERGTPCYEKAPRSIANKCSSQRAQ